MKSASFKDKRPQPIVIHPCDDHGPTDSPNMPPLSPVSSNSQTGGMTKTDEPVRVVVLGSAKVGKTAIIKRFLYDRFETKYTPTVEDTHSRKFVVHDHQVHLVLIDTAGSFDFPAMIRLWIDKANAFVLVFSHDNPESLVQAGSLLNQIKSQRKDYAPLISTSPRFIPEANAGSSLSKASQLSPGSPPITVVCNKSDLPLASSRINESVIMEWLLSHGLKPSQFVYASAKSNESIQDIFKSLWIQNEATKSIHLERYDVTRRPSMLNTRPQTPPLPTTNFSALSGTMPEEGNDGTNEAERTPFKARPSIFRSSLRLVRRTSSKSMKAKNEVTYADCVLS